MSYSSLRSKWPPELAPHELRELTSKATTYAVAHGLQYLPPATTALTSSTPATAVHAPVTLFPSPFPRKLFEHARKLQRIYNILYARISMDNEILEDIVGETGEGEGESDKFIAKLWLMADKHTFMVHNLGIFRSDYLLHAPAGDANKSLSLKQVEFNTIAASFGALSSRTAAMHRYLQASTDYFKSSPVLTAENFPINNAVTEIAEGLAAAHKVYNVLGTQILFVVQPDERNVFDQHLLEHELLEKHSIRVVKQTFEQLLRSVRRNSPTRSLELSLNDDGADTNPVEISTIYFRAGYDAKDYENDSHYDVRFYLERSLAIKCPSIPMQIAGGKKVQQVLTKPGVLESFLCNPDTWGEENTFTMEDCDLLRANWMGMFPLDEDEPLPNGGGEGVTTMETSGVRKARENAHSLVLKPQREGGGHNVFKEDIPAFLDTLPTEHRQAWIAQELITPPRGMANLLMRSDDETRTAVKTEVVSELGIYGWNLYHPTRGMKEREAGWLLRTKNKDVNEGGVASGYAVLDSIVLVDD